MKGEWLVEAGVSLSEQQAGLLIVRDRGPGTRSSSCAYMLCAQLLQSCLTLCDTMDCSSPGSAVLGDSPSKNWSGLPRPPPGDLPHPGIKPRSPALAGRVIITSAPWGESDSRLSQR